MALMKAACKLQSWEHRRIWSYSRKEQWRHSRNESYKVCCPLCLRFSISFLCFVLFWSVVFFRCTLWTQNILAGRNIFCWIFEIMVSFDSDAEPLCFHCFGDLPNNNAKNAVHSAGPLRRGAVSRYMICYGLSQFNIIICLLLNVKLVYSSLLYRVYPATWI